MDLDLDLDSAIAGLDTSLPVGKFPKKVSGVARLEWARVQRFQKGPVVPLNTEFVCSANKHSPYSGNVCRVGLIGLKFVIQAISGNFRRNQLLQACVIHYS